VHHDEQIRQIELLLHRLDTGTTVDAGVVHQHDTSVYVDPDIAEREWTAFFRGHPQVVGLSGDLPEPGSFFTVDDLGVPIIVSRGDDGTVHALVNACRHRGARVESAERGTTRRFTCPFHRWTYATDGTLAGVPKVDHFGEFDRHCNGLVELPAVERHRRRRAAGRRARRRARELAVRRAPLPRPRSLRRAVQLEAGHGHVR
jgi:nitrite reductase/ring-hydroxylating ferredoxin subunit